MRYILLMFLFILTTKISHGQDFKAGELIKICKLSLSDAETYLLGKDYTMVDTRDDSLKTYVEFENDKVQHSVRITKYKGILGIIDIEYMTLKPNEFVQFKNYLTLQKYKYEGSKVTTAKVSVITSIYMKGNYTFWLYSYSTKSETDNKTIINWYKIQISIYPEQ